MNDGAPAPRIVEPDPDAGVVSVIMLPRHFLAYQRWLHSRGLKVLPFSGAQDTYSVTLIDSERGQDPDSDRPLWTAYQPPH